MPRTLSACYDLVMADACVLCERLSRVRTDHPGTSSALSCSDRPRPCPNFERCASADVYNFVGGGNRFVSRPLSTFSCPAPRVRRPDSEWRGSQGRADIQALILPKQGSCGDSSMHIAEGASAEVTGSRLASCGTIHICGQKAACRKFVAESTRLVPF